MTVLDCFLLDEIPAGVSAVYDSMERVSAIAVGEDGQIIRTSHNGGRFEVPLFTAPDEFFEYAAALLLIEVAMRHLKRIHFSIQNASRTLMRRDLTLKKVITYQAHPIIPKKMVIACAEPTYLGVFTIQPPRRGIALYNPKSVVGYMPGP